MSAVSHQIISASDVFIARWQPVLAQLGRVTLHRDLHEVLDVRQAAPLSCVLDMQLFAEPPSPESLMMLAHATSLILEFQSLSVDEELAWLAVGVRACCTPALAAERLAVIVDVTFRGGVWVSTPALPTLLKGLRHFTAQQAVPAAAPALAVLTPQERKIADLVGRGESNKVIARELNISDRTVKAHLSAIFSKLDLNDRLHLALLVNRQSSP